MRKVWKKIFSSFVCLSFIISTCIIPINPIGVYAEPVTMFSDGFESGDFTAAGWINSGCDIQTETKYAGSQAAIFDSSDSLRISLSTIQCESIQVQYTRMSSACETDDHFIVEWYNGSSWTTLEDLTGDSSWSEKAWDLPSGANNNASFSLRFKTNHNDSSDYAYLDEVKIIGTQIDTQAPTAPTDLISTSKTDTTVDLSWDASTDNEGVVPVWYRNRGLDGTTQAGWSCNNSRETIHSQIQSKIE